MNVFSEEDRVLLASDDLTESLLKKASSSSSASAKAAGAAASFPLSLSASAAAAAAASGEGREFGFGGGGGVGGGGLFRLNPSEVILREISFDARSTTPGELGALLPLVAAALLIPLAGPALLLPLLDEVVEPGPPLFIVRSGRPINHRSTSSAPLSRPILKSSSQKV